MVGALQWYFVTVPFLKDGDPNADVGHFQVIHRGRSRSVHVASALDAEEGSKLFRIPARYERLTCVGVVATGDMMFDILVLPHPLIRSAGEEAAGTIELTAVPDRGGWRIGSTILRHVKVRASW